MIELDRVGKRYPASQGSGGHDALKSVTLSIGTGEFAVVAGWNRLLMKVYDQGGGWGLMARLREADGSAVTDLLPALDATGAWSLDQADGDGDGLGDLCDDTP